jgi:hypothetical protein
MAKAVKKKAVRKPKSKASDLAIVEKRAQAYHDMEPHLCDVVRMGEIAFSLFDCSDRGHFVFAVGHLEEMLLELRKRYYALDFRP